MTANHSPDAAVDDADLIRWLDGELDDEERTRVNDAVARDPVLAARLEQLRGRSARLSTLLEGTDPDLAAVAADSRVPAGKVIELNAAWAARQGMPARAVPPPRPMPGWLQAAAILAMLLSASLLVPPVRAWIVGLLRPVDVPGSAASGPPAPVTAVLVDTLGIRFPSAAPVFTLEFMATPASGRLSVESTSADSLIVESFTPARGGDLLRVRDDLVRVNNPGAPSADYHVVLPARVTTIRVLVPGRDDIVWRVGQDGAHSWSLDLGAAAR